MNIWLEISNSPHINTFSGMLGDLARAHEFHRHRAAAGEHGSTAALDIAEIAPDCDLFIGAGGTMTREMAVLGIPTISVYQEKLLDVDRHLMARDALLHRPRLTAAEALRYLEQSTRRPPTGNFCRRVAWPAT